MKIADYALTMQASHSGSQQSSIREELRIWVDLRAAAAPPPPDSERVTLSAAAQTRQAGEAAAIDAAMDDVENDPRLQLIILMVERMTGQKVRLFAASQLRAARSADSLTVPPDMHPAAPARAGFGMAYSRELDYSESEQTSMQADGVIKTNDGKQIKFSLNLVMQRQYSETSRSEVRIGAAPPKTDPLVINFNGTAAQLSGQRFAFDLDSDGKDEQINAPRAGSGFLALDLNGDGTIGSGEELFGPATGNGFGELAQYDSDRNGWIDEADPVFQKLKVWLKQATGQGELAGLDRLGVGAISLHAIDTPFDLKDAANQLLGNVRMSSVYLGEDGSAGSVQQVDLVA